MTGSAVAAVAAVAFEPLSADQQTRLHRAIWSERALLLGIEVTVPPCPYGDGELVHMQAHDRTVGYLPHELSSHLTRDRFGSMFPGMDSYAESPANGFVNATDAWGWFDYETAREAAILNRDEATVLAELAEAGTVMLTLDQYIVASQDQFLLTGRHLDDEHTWSRLATRYDGRLIAARFDGVSPARGREDEATAPGSLLVAYDLTPADNGEMLGVRSRSSTRSARAAWEHMWARTTAAYLRAGFPARLGTDPDTYLASLPRIPAQPPGYTDRFDIPLVVEPRIPWQEQAQLLGVRLSSNSQRLSFAEVDPSASPAVPYVGWFNTWHDRYPDAVSSIEARAQLAEDECGSSAIELLAMDTALPDLARTTRFFEAIGFVVTSPLTQDMTNRRPGRCLCMYRWRGSQELGVNQHPIPYPMFRPLVRGRDVTITSPATSEEHQ